MREKEKEGERGRERGRIQREMDTMTTVATADGVRQKDFVKR